MKFPVTPLELYEYNRTIHPDEPNNTTVSLILAI